MVAVMRTVACRAFRKKAAVAMTLLAPLIIHPSALRRREVPRKTIEVSIVGHNEIIGAYYTLVYKPIAA